MLQTRRRRSVLRAVRSGQRRPKPVSLSARHRHEGGHPAPGPGGHIDQQILGRSIAAEIALHSGDADELVQENAGMKRLAYSV